MRNARVGKRFCVIALPANQDVVMLFMSVAPRPSPPQAGAALQIQRDAKPRPARHHKDGAGRGLGIFID